MTPIPPKFSFVYDGARIHIYHANKGEGLPAHTHVFSHATFCTSGKCYVRKKDKEVLVDKNSQPINLIANEWHEIEAVEDDTVFINVFAEEFMRSETLY
jgi:quercetin dioxygenase-like cupin family protein